MTRPVRRPTVKHVLALRAEIKQMFVDVEVWNDTYRPAGHARIDPDPDGRMTAALDRVNHWLMARGVV